MPVEAMDPVGVGLAGVSCVELCIRLGKKLIRRYRTYKNAEEEFAVAFLRFQDIWLKIDMELTFIRKIFTTLPEELQLHINSVAQRLHVLLTEANTLLDSAVDEETTEEPSKASDIDLEVDDEGQASSSQTLLHRRPSSSSSFLSRFSTSSGSVKSISFAFKLKKHITRTLDDLNSWHEVLEKWLLLLSLLQNNVSIDEHLQESLANDLDDGSSTLGTVKDMRNALGIRRPSRKGTLSSTSSSTLVRLGSNFLESKQLSQDFLDHYIGTISGTKIRCYESSKAGRPVLAETMRATYMDHSDRTSDLGRLAHVLSSTKALSFGVPECHGFITSSASNGSEENHSGNQLIFSVPDSLHSPRTLRRTLQTTKSFPLEERFKLATSLARSVFFVHTADFVHKGICPDSIILFTSNQPAGGVLGSPFLLGFDRFRSLSEHSVLGGLPEWERDIYRHPTRQGALPIKTYRMQHDIYSLGACLLEIGLWESFLDTAADASVIRSNFLSEALDFRIMKGNSHVDRKAAVAQLATVKDVLIKAAATRLPAVMGSKYTDITLMCLKCLDGEASGFGSQIEFLDDYGVLIGVRYIEKVLGRLESLVL